MSVRSNDPSSARVTLTATPIVASCTEMLFGKAMGDDVDVLVGQGEILHQTSSIAVRFDCAHVTPKQVTFQWYYNNSALCTYTYISNKCDHSSLIFWDELPGKYLVTLQSKDYFYNATLPPGDYRLVIFALGNEL